MFSAEQLPYAVRRWGGGGDKMQRTTDRLVLREFVESDWQTVLAYQTDERYLHYYAWESRTPEEVQAFVGMFLDMRREQPRSKFQLAIVERESGRLIGSCGIRKETPDALEAELGYELAPDMWGNGYATEAARAMVTFGFRELGVHRIWANCIADNGPSTRVLGRLGMRLEGRLREKEYFKGRWWDMLLYGLLESEWRS